MAKKKRVQHKRKMKEKETVYVKIDNALAFRKEILETAIEVATLQKRLESYKILREMKLQQIRELKSLMNKIENEFSGFKRDLPKVELEEEKKIEKHVEVVKVSLPEKNLSDIDRELEEIKAKIAQLRV